MGRAKQNRLLRELSDEMLLNLARTQWFQGMARHVETDAYLKTQGATLNDAYEAADAIQGHLGRYQQLLRAVMVNRERRRQLLDEQVLRAAHRVARG